MSQGRTGCSQGHTEMSVLEALCPSKRQGGQILPSLVGPRGRLCQGDCSVLLEYARTRPGSVLVSSGACC